MILEGSYVLDMPAFDIKSVLWMARKQELHMAEVAAVSEEVDNGDSAIVPKPLTRSQSKRVWEDDSDESKLNIDQSSKKLRNDDAIVRTPIPQRQLTDEEAVILFHRRMGHIYVNRLIDGFQRMTFTGYMIPKSMLRKKHLNLLPKCDTCRSVKAERLSFKSGAHATTFSRPGEILCADIHVFANCPGRDGTIYRANFTDPNTEKLLSYRMKKKSEFFEALKNVVHDYHEKYSLASWKLLYCDQEAGLNTDEARKWLEDNKIRLITSPTDTPEMNGIAEESNKWMGEVTGSLLHHSGRMVTFWNEAYDYAIQIRDVLPFNTPFGFKSPYEILTGEIPSVSHYHVWGCKAWVLEPRSEHRKDWHGRAVSGWFAGLSEEDPRGFKVWVPELNSFVISVNVTFDENIPIPDKEYHDSLKDVLLPIGTTDLSVEDIKSRYIGKTFIEEDDGKLYTITAVRRDRKGDIVAEVTMEGATRPARAPIHIADVIRMMNQALKMHNIVMFMEETLNRVGEAEAISYRNCKAHVLNEHLSMLDNVSK
jgi:hypothetical protein